MVITASSAPSAEELRNKAEAILAQRPAWQLTDEANSQRLLHELQVHQIELEMQNEALQLEIERVESEVDTRKQAEQELRHSEQRFRDIAQVSADWIWEVDAQERYTYVSESVHAMLGYRPAELIGKTPFDLMAKDEALKVATAFRQLTATKQSFTNLGNIVFGKNGAAHFTLTNGTPILDEQGNLLGYRGVDRDISEAKLAEDELRIAAVAFEAQNAMVVTDPNGVILRVNPSFTRITGYSSADVIGRTMSILKSGRHDALFYRRLWDSLKEKGAWQGEIWNKRKNGLIYAEMLFIKVISTPDHRTLNYVASFSDITEDKEAEAEIHRLAYYDALTELPNRRLLQDRVGQAVLATARSGLIGALFFIDLDNFKALNDTRGHEVGDQLLVAVALRLRAAVREGDTVARQGGDEFVVLMRELSAEIDEAASLAKQLAEKLRDAIDRPFDLNGHEYHCTLSIGIGLFDNKKTVEDLFKHADLALYQAKNAGRNTLRFFDPVMQQALEQRSTLEAELRLALKHRQLRLYYQPQMDGARRVIGVEALLRWQHPKRGPVPPNDFIPLAEDSGLILPIGLWVLKTACAQLKLWEKGPDTQNLIIAVNVSARQFRQSNFVDEVQQVLESSGINPALLKLELTESLVLEDVSDTVKKIEAIKCLGVSFSMDDFGTGYSSLTYLTRLPIDQLKIDQSFVRSLPGPKRDETIARTIISMGGGLDMHVIAEGVETEEQLLFLEANGCQAYQGYLFSRPLPIEALTVFLQQNANCSPRQH